MSLQIRGYININVTSKSLVKHFVFGSCKNFDQEKQIY